MDNRILLICHDYHPTPSANTLCVEPIVDHLVSLGFAVDWVCVRSSLRSKTMEFSGGVTVHRVFSLAELLYRLSRRLLGSGGRVRPFVGKALSYAMGRVFAGRAEGYLSTWEWPATKCAKRLAQSRHYSAMVSVSAPATAHLIAQEVKKGAPELPWIIYQLDPFALNYVLPPEGMAARKAIESDFTAQADVVVAARGILEENERQGFRPEGPRQRLSLELPNLLSDIERPISDGDPILRERLGFSLGQINLVYAGAFYGGGVRPADGVIELIRKMPNGFGFHILGGSADVALRRLQQPPSRLRIHGRLNSYDSDMFIDQADVLLSVGNNLPNQMPSKVFRYMSTGKPIVHLQYHKDDLCVDLLRKYEHALIVPAETVGDDTRVNEVAHFCREYAGIPALSPDEINLRMRGFTSQDAVSRFTAAVLGLLEMGA